ncbi:type VI secretion system protein TssL, short form [Pseudomonas sp. LFM046]|uniref:type VI secretion system protein TssL, short form n=1 Tax=Pseudomonas sp. LFM046 TaxID=1608357 RepID=UPI0005CFCFB9|nr:type VI secretion system protein TssL, short form [Pseudomonas sp. LFM046]
MSLKTEAQTLSAVDVDALLQDSYLLVVELRGGATAGSGRDLWKRCSNQVEEVRQRLKDAGMSQRSVDHISYAQCALLDETVLGFAKEEAHADWAAEPLQAKFFNRHQAGEFLYEDMHEVLREPAPDLHVMTAFQRVLMLGFKGRYSDLQHPEREQLLRVLSTRVAPLVTRHALISRVGRVGGFRVRRWLSSPFMQCLVVAVLLVGAWWGLNYLLGDAISSLLPGRV